MGFPILRMIPMIPMIPICESLPLRGPTRGPVDPSPPQSQPVIPRLPQLVARTKVVLTELRALRNLPEDALHREIVRMQDGVSHANRRLVMRVAPAVMGSFLRAAYS